MHNIRTATSKDIQMLSELLQKDKEHANWREADLLEYIDKENHALLVIGQDPNGFLIYSQVLDEIEIIMLWVAPESRNAGFGSAILNHLLKICRTNHISGVFLEVAKDNNSAILLYRNNGFVEIGRRRAYYTRANGETIDAIIMQNSCL